MFQTRRAEHMAYIVCWGYGWNLQLDGGYSAWCAQVSSPDRWERDEKCLAHWQVNKSQWCLAQDDKSQTCQKCLAQINRSPWCLAQDDKHQVSAWHINVSAAWHRSQVLANFRHVRSAWHRMTKFQTCQKSVAQNDQISDMSSAWQRMTNLRHGISAWQRMTNLRHVKCLAKDDKPQTCQVLGKWWQISDMSSVWQRMTNLKHVMY